jgi:hypothetical protein
MKRSERMQVLIGQLRDAMDHKEMMVNLINELQPSRWLREIAMSPSFSLRTRSDYRYAIHRTEEISDMYRDQLGRLLTTDREEVDLAVFSGAITQNEYRERHRPKNNIDILAAQFLGRGLKPEPAAAQVIPAFEPDPRAIQI